MIVSATDPPPPPGGSKLELGARNRAFGEFCGGVCSRNLGFTSP